MTLEHAKLCIGCPVETNHAGHKLIRSIAWHGPYILKKVTKAGLCILEGYEEFRVPPSQIRYYDWIKVGFDKCVDLGIGRYYTNAEIEVIVRPLVKQLLEKQDAEVIKILLAK